MYKVSAPISIFNYRRDFDREYALRELRRTRTDRVIIHATDIFDTENTDKKMLKLSECSRFFESNGFETGVWIGQTIGHGGFGRIRMPLTNIVTADGRTGENTLTLDCSIIPYGFVGIRLNGKSSFKILN